MSRLTAGISDERDAGTVFTVYQPVEIDNPLPSAIHAMAGVNQRFGAFVSFNAEGYAKQHSNLPVSKWNPEPRIEIETALADGLTYGADVRIMLEKPEYYATVSYGWSASEYEAVSGDLGAWVEEPVFSYPPAHDQRHKLNLTAGFEISGFNLDTRWEYGSGKPYTKIYGYDFYLRLPFENPNTDTGQARILFSEPYNGRMPSYHRLDVSISRDFRHAGNVLIETQAGSHQCL